MVVTGFGCNNIYALLSLDPFIFSMPGIMSLVLGPSADPGVGLGYGFESGHITPFV